jgi:hypothetical protein
MFHKYSFYSQNVLLSPIQLVLRRADCCSMTCRLRMLTTRASPSTSCGKAAWCVEMLPRLLGLPEGEKATRDNRESRWQAAGDLAGPDDSLIDTFK